MPHPNQPIVVTLKTGTVTITNRVNVPDWHACLTNEEQFWSCAKTPAEAIGSLIITHPERFAVLPQA